MKKLMIAAAAAAMVGGAFADDAIKITYNWVTNEALQACQVLQYKEKAFTEKSINLDGDKKKFGKTLKNTTLAVDGVYYYVGNGKWRHFEWNKEEVLFDKEESAPAFDIFENNDKNKALAAYEWADGEWNTKTSKWEQFADGHAEAYSYGALKYVTEKDEAGKKVKKLDTMVKSIKDVSGFRKYTIKTFKKTNKKTVEQQIAEYFAKITKKAPKAK